MTRRPVFAAVLALFFLSGACGLVYEVIWVRMLALVFGTTTFALSALLTSFMAGLGLGSLVSGRYLAGTRRPLALFGALECGIGASALALPWLFPLAERGFIAATAGLGLGFYGESLMKLGLSLALLVPPTTLMGASLPLLAQHAVARLGHLGIRVGSLYALNTLGAVAGCFAAGFFLIPAWGIRATTLAAAALNFAVGIAALALAAASRPRLPAGQGVAQPPHLGDSLYSERARRWAVVAFACSGFAALGLEVIWTRLLTLVLVGFTYSFSTMLTLFLMGIALGSLVFGRVADRTRDPLAILGLVQTGAGVSALATAPLFLEAQAAAHLGGLMLGGEWADHALAKFAVAAALLLPTTFLFGASFPLVSRLAAPGRKGLGHTVGQLYAANVAGSIAGAFVTGYVLIPLFGSHRSLLGLALGVALVGAGLLRASRVSALACKRLTLAGGILATLAIVLGPADVSRSIHQRWLTPGERMGFYEEGASATVMVAEYTNAEELEERRILVSGSSASNSTFYGLSVNRIQGCLPFLFKRMPRKVLAICFGTGITFGTASQFEIERIDGVDISPEVFAAAPRFAAENYDVARNPRVRLIVDDGRNFLLKNSARYDAITMEPMPPALAGVVNLYTREFYALCRQRLAPGGVMSQWVPLYFLGPDDVRMLYRTFAESFPYALAFSYNFDTFLVGSERPLDLSGERFCRRLVSERLARDLATIGLDGPQGMLGTFLMGREAMLRFAASAPLLTDDWPLVEFTGPKTIDTSSMAGNYLTLTRFAEPASRYLSAEGGPEAERLREALDTIFRDQEIRWGMARGESVE